MPCVLLAKQTVLALVQTNETRTSQILLWLNAVTKLRLLLLCNMKKNVFAMLPASCFKVCGPIGTNVLPFDLSWPNLIYGPGPRIISFVLNAQINSVCTPDMLKLWGYISCSTCVLCNAGNCTLHHLLVNCKFALDQGRYTWRHDSVLLDIEQALLKLVRSFNSKKPACFADVAGKSTR